MSPNSDSTSPSGSRRPPSGRPIIFGEVLFDVFPDGKAVLGGASFNVAWNLQGFGLRPLFISRIGEDERGGEVLESMKRWGMDTAGVQIDGTRPTGVVRVTIHGGEPEFEIAADQAYDLIDAGEACARVSEEVNAGLLYHGTLALRSEVSRSALASLKERYGLPVFLDVNLRDPWWDSVSAQEALRGARWLKLNDEELRVLTEEILVSDHEIEVEARKQRRELDLEQLIVTLGERGALTVRHNDEILDCQAPEVEDLQDTVGAGDGFSAATILGMLRGWPEALSLKRAVEFAAFICTLRGATSEDASHHGSFVKRWEEQGLGDFPG